jgi:hypothetical protein
MARLKSWLIQVLRGLTIIAPFGLAIFFAGPVTNSLDRQSQSPKKLSPYKRAAAAAPEPQQAASRPAAVTAHNSVPGDLAAVTAHNSVPGDLADADSEKRAAPNRQQQVLAQPSAAPAPAPHAEPANKELEESRKLGFEEEYHHMVLLAQQTQATESIAKELENKIQKQRALADQLAAKFAHKEFIQEQESELRRLAEERIAAERKKIEELERLKELRRIAEETKAAREKFLAEQQKNARELELQRMRHLAEKERLELENSIKQQQEAERVKRENEARRIAREKLELETKMLEAKAIAAQKLRFEREKELINEQLRIEKLQLQLATEERKKIEQQFAQTAEQVAPSAAAPRPAPAAAAKVVEAAAPPASAAPQTIPVPEEVGAAPLAAAAAKSGTESRESDKGAHPANRESPVTDPVATHPADRAHPLAFDHISTRENAGRLQLNFAILKRNPKAASFEGEVIAIGKYTGRNGETLYTTSTKPGKVAPKELAKLPQGTGAHFKIKNIVAKKVEIAGPGQGEKLIDLWLIARDPKGRVLGKEQIKTF